MTKRRPRGSFRPWPEELEARHCLSSWFAALVDSDVRPTAVAQYSNAAQVAVLGSTERNVDGSQYEDGVALQVTNSGRTAREVLLSVDPARPFPGEVATLLADAEFSQAGQLIVVGTSASNLAVPDTSLLLRLDGEPSVWTGDFVTGFSVLGLGFPSGVPALGTAYAVSLRNGGVSAVQVHNFAAYSIDCGVPTVIMNDGLPVVGFTTATNGNRIVVAEVTSGLSFFYDISPTGEILNRTELERPEDVFSVYGTAISDNGWMSGFGEVYNEDTGDTTTVTLVWRPDGSLAKRIGFAGQLVESRINADGAVFFQVSTPLGQTLGNEGAYAYLTGADSMMSVAEWVGGLGLNVPGLTLSGNQKVVDAEWNFTGQGLNLLVDSTDGTTPDFVIHLEGLSFAPRPATCGDNCGENGDQGGSDEGDPDGDCGCDDDGGNTGGGTDTGGGNTGGGSDSGNGEGDNGGGTNTGGGNTGGGDTGGGNTGGNTGGGTDSGNGGGNNGGGNTGGSNGGNTGGGNTGGNAGGSDNSGGGVLPPGDTGGSTGNGGGNTGGQTGNGGNPGPTPGGNSGSNGGGSTDGSNQGGSNSTGNGSDNGAGNGANNGGGKGGNTTPQGNGSGPILNGLFDGVFADPRFFDGILRGRDGAANGQPSPPVETPSRAPSRGPLPAQIDVRDQQQRQGDAFPRSVGGGGEVVPPPQAPRLAPSLSDVLGWLLRKLKAVLTLDLSALDEPMPQGKGKETKPVTVREQSQRDTADAPAAGQGNNEAPPQDNDGAQPGTVS